MSYDMNTRNLPVLPARPVLAIPKSGKKEINERCACTVFRQFLFYPESLARLAELEIQIRPGQIQHKERMDR